MLSSLDQFLIENFFVKVNLGGNVNKLTVNLAIVLLNILVIDYEQSLLFGEVCRASKKYLWKKVVHETNPTLLFVYFNQKNKNTNALTNFAVLVIETIY